MGVHYFKKNIGKANSQLAYHEGSTRGGSNFTVRSRKDRRDTQKSCFGKILHSILRSIS